MMRRFLFTITLLTALAAWCLPVSAIKVESAEQPKEKTETTDKAEPAKRSDSETDKAKAEEAASPKAASGGKSAEESKTSGSLLDQLKRKVMEVKKDPAPKYDRFRDADNDGVSDRVRKARQSEAVQPEPTRKVAKPTPSIEKPAAKEPPKTKKKAPATPKKTSTSKKKDPN